MSTQYVPKGETDKKLFMAMNNEELVQKLSKCKTPEECYDATKSYIPGITFSEYSEAMKLINASLDESKDGLLSEADMEAVAGGCETCSIITTAATVVGAAATAAGAAS